MSQQTVSCLPPKWLHALVEELRDVTTPLSMDSGKSMLQQIDVSASVASGWTRFDPRFYTRSSVYKSAACELLVMGWLGGQISPLHNHKDSICVLKILSGTAIEISYDRSEIGLLTPRAIMRQSEGFLSASADADVHQVGNDSSTPLVTLHLYSPPLHNAEWFPQSESLLFDRSASVETRARQTQAA